MNTLVPQSQNPLLDQGAGKNQRSQVGQFCTWLDQTGRQWWQPDLGAYKIYLQKERHLQPASVIAHLSNIRSRYKQLLIDRDLFYALVPTGTDLVTAKTMVDEIVVRIENTLKPEATRIRQHVIQDESDDRHVWLTVEQVDNLIRAPGIQTPMGLRDTALIALMLATGIREMEACQLVVGDLRKLFGGHLALQVRHGKGNKKRLIPYGDQEWVLVLVDKWLQWAQITEGRVFRRLFKPRDGRPQVGQQLSERAVQLIVSRYPVPDQQGKWLQVRPHDLRRTYARRMKYAGMEREKIQYNMGHTNADQTDKYIGRVDVEDRVPPQAYDVPYDLIGGETPRS